MEYYSGIREKEILSFVTWMKPEQVLLSEKHQTEKDEYYDITYVQNLKSQTYPGPGEACRLFFHHLFTYLLPK